MQINFVRLLRPEDVPDEPCVLCNEATSPSLVIARLGDDNDSIGAVCNTCVAYLNYRSPASFPSLESLRELREQYPNPAYSSSEAVERLSVSEFWHAYEAANLSR